MNMFLKYSGFLLTLLSASGMATAQDLPKGERGESAFGSRGVTVTVAEIMKNPDIISFDSMVRRALKSTESESEREDLPSDPAARSLSQWPPPQPGNNEGKGHFVPFSPQSIGTQWTGSQAGNLFPPDSFGAVGPTQVLCTTNSQVRVFDKSGNLGALAVTLDSFFQSVRNGGTSDPRATFDRLTNKWYVCAITVASPFRIVLAVSNGPTITNTSSFTFFFVSRGTVLPDYPSLGVDANGIYIGENSFNNGASYAGTKVTVIQKSSVQGAGPIFSTVFTTAAANGEGPFAPRGVDNDDPAPANGYIIGPSNIAFSRLVVRKVTGAETLAPTMGPNLLVPVNVTANPIATVPSIGQSIDALDDRIFHAQMYRNRKTGARTVWCAHNIRMNSSGTGSSGGDRNGARWYEVDVVAAAPDDIQSGTAFNSAASGFDHYTIPSCAMSGQGHMAIGFTMTRSGQLIRIGAAGRLAGDGPGNTQAATLAFTSPANYNPGISRWGDYSGTFVDPTDDQTMWTFQEFGAATNQWGVRIIKLVAPAPSNVSNVTPNTLNPGQNANITITGTSVAGSEYYDTDAGYPKRLVCAFNSDITVNSVTFSHATPQQIVLNVTVAGGAGPGPRNLTITNPDGQAVTANAAVTINSGGSTEVLIPTAEQIVFGTTNSGGDLASWAADDNNGRKVCRFFIPNAQVMTRMNLSYTTTKLAPTAISFDVKISAHTPVVQLVTLRVENKVTNLFVDTNVVLANIVDGTTYNGVPPGTLADYVGGGGAMRGQIEIKQTGVSALSFPCTTFEFGQMKVTG